MVAIAIAAGAAVVGFGIIPSPLLDLACRRGPRDLRLAARPAVEERYRPYQFAGGLIYLDVDESPADAPRAEGRYEPEKMAALQRLLEPGMTFVDAGSNKGDFALIARASMSDRGRVAAPSSRAPDNCRAGSAASVELNGYRERPSSSSSRCSTRDGARDLVPRRLERLALARSRRGSGRRESIEVADAHARLGARRDRRSAHVDVLKIDVEGA